MSRSEHLVKSLLRQVTAPLVTPGVQDRNARIALQRPSDASVRSRLTGHLHLPEVVVEPPSLVIDRGLLPQAANHARQRRRPRDGFTLPSVSVRINHLEEVADGQLAVGEATVLAACRKCCHHQFLTRQPSHCWGSWESRLCLSTRHWHQSRGHR